MPTGPDRNQELEHAIDGVVQSYESTLEINNLESAALPNKRAVVQALNHLKPLIYMGFYSQRSLNKSNLRYGVSEHVYPAYEALVEQIARAVSYEATYRNAVRRDVEWSADVVIRLLRQLPELRRVLNCDVIAAYEGDPAATSFEEIVFSYPAVEAITTHRIAHALQREGVPIIPRIMAYHAHERTGVDIHPGASIDEGFFMDHGTGVVIGETATIGRNVKIYQGVTIGALSTRRAESQRPLPKKRHPTIEDDVTIYSGATILGGETVIGRGAVIGGNQWIVKSVAPGSKIFGRAKEGE
ncbi:MAG TPA: serine acetyltransferase [Polyangiaceae bacterium]|jgi:serine O-acetyltransferase|nr:serine acetyltransferase [Polyangiaceae bacterium]